MNAIATETATLDARVQALVALFERIAATRMQGVPMLHEALRVAAVGFEPDAGAGDAVGAVGVLVTPWFMNLVWLPLRESTEPLAVRASRMRAVGNERFEFLGAHEEGFGPFEACSLFSPMFQFEDQAAALATAEEVLRQLRRAPEAPVAAPAAEPMPARRAWLLARGTRGSNSGAEAGR